jgi:O-6-methylguanine DNA methyltransferase
MTKKQRCFSDRVRAVVRKIPKGKTMTYKQVATKAGNPKAARAVGMIMSHNFDSKIPCHRVVRGDGKKRRDLTIGLAARYRLLAVYPYRA